MRPIPGIQLEDQPEDFLIPACVWDEARGEHTLGMIAVWNVIQTRARESGLTAKQVILRAKAFSGFNAGAKDRIWMLLAWQQDPTGWKYVEQAIALAKTTGDPTFGSNHYYNPALATPLWGRGSPHWEEHVVIGHQVFGRCP